MRAWPAPPQPPELSSVWSDARFPRTLLPERHPLLKYSNVGTSEKEMGHFYIGS